jgi:type III secretion protein S
MNTAVMTHEVQTSMMSALILAGPILGVLGIIGLLIGLLQAVTQIQDQTLGQIIKLGVASVLLIVAGPRLATPLVNHAEELFKTFHMIVR